ncbi:MAG TPA: nucleotidyltransferase family protein [Vicinamibacterales bacterium]|nr:nucleotidyltransferase family protein [Vicinamibacterales bacterium]
MISGIVLAAGASSRMGQAKAALPLGQTGDTVVARVVRTLLEGGVPNIVVVGGAHIDAVRAAMPRRESRARLIEHAGWEQGQLSSLLAGLNAIDDPLLEAAVVTLVDVPLVRSSTVAELIAAWRRTRAPIVRPANADRHGHPVIFDRSIFADLRSADPNTGAKAVFAIHRERILNVEVDDAGAFEDIDTPEDYRRVLGT